MTETIEKRPRVQFFPTGESKTEQAHQQKQNINTIMRKYQKTGMLPSCVHPGQYGDFTSVGEYHECSQRVLDAQEEFNSLPANVRKRFANSPAKLLEFLANSENLDEAIELGIIPKPEVEPPVEPPAEPPAE